LANPEGGVSSLIFNFLLSALIVLALPIYFSDDLRLSSKEGKGGNDSSSLLSNCCISIFFGSIYPD